MVAFCMITAYLALNCICSILKILEMVKKDPTHFKSLPTPPTEICTPGTQRQRTTMFAEASSVKAPDWKLPGAASSK